KVNSRQLNKGMFDGAIEVVREDNTPFQLKYMFINEDSDYPALANFSFFVKPFDVTHYEYELYVTEDIKLVQVHLFEPSSLLYKGELLQLKNLQVGTHQGTLRRKDLDQTGHYYGLIVVQLQNGTFVSYDTELFL